jgi:hypothetical protein
VLAAENEEELEHWLVTLDEAHQNAVAARAAANLALAEVNVTQ